MRCMNGATLYQHVARHRYAASGSQPSLFFSSAACRRAASVAVNFTVNECSSSGCLVPHVLKPVHIKKYARISSSDHDIRGRLSVFEAYGSIQGNKRRCSNYYSYYKCMHLNRLSPYAYFMVGYAISILPPNQPFRIG